LGLNILSGPASPPAIAREPNNVGYDVNAADMRSSSVPKRNRYILPKNKRIKYLIRRAAVEQNGYALEYVPEVLREQVTKAAGIE
jgi:hypothetical protein